MEIDEAAFSEITKGHSAISVALWRNAIEAYESAKQSNKHSEKCPVCTPTKLCLNHSHGVQLNKHTLPAFSDEIIKEHEANLYFAEGEQWTQDADYPGCSKQPWCGRGKAHGGECQEINVKLSSQNTGEK